MGIDSGNQLIFKMTNVVSNEIDVMLDVVSESATNDNTAASTDTTMNRRKKIIDCDVSNIVHKLAYQHNGIYSAVLVRDTALFLKQLAADTGYTVTAVLDGDIRPYTKRDAFKRRYHTTMN